MAIFPLNFNYKNRWGLGFGLWAKVCCILLWGIWYNATSWICQENPEDYRNFGGCFMSGTAICHIPKILCISWSEDDSEWFRQTPLKLKKSLKGNRAQKSFLQVKLLERIIIKDHFNKLECLYHESRFSTWKKYRNIWDKYKPNNDGEYKYPLASFVSSLDCLNSILNFACPKQNSFFFFNWSRVDIKCCASCRHTAQWFCVYLSISKYTFSDFCLIGYYKILSAQLFATPWTVACQAPLFMGFPRQDIAVGCHAFFEGIFVSQGSNPCLLQLLHCRWSLYWATREAHTSLCYSENPHWWSILYIILYIYLNPRLLIYLPLLSIGNHNFVF